MENNQKYIDLLNEAKELAFFSLSNFFNNLDLDPTLFNHLYNTKIIIDYNYSKTDGNQVLYDNNKDVIYIDFYYLSSSYKYIRNDCYKDIELSDIASKIVRELIHKSRNILLKEEINGNNVSDIMLQNSNYYSKKAKKIHEYDDILSYINLDKYKSSKYIPIKVYIYKDNYYTFIAYNKITKKYEIFNKQFFKAKFNNNLEEFLDKLSKEVLDTKNHDSNESYPSILFNDKKEHTYMASELYTSLLKNNDNYIKTKSELLDKIGDIESTITKQSIFEDAIINVLSKMIVLSKNDNGIDFEELSDKVINGTKSNIIINTANFIKTCDSNIIRSFILACYDDTYRNTFYEEFGNNYSQVLDLFNIADSGIEGVITKNKILELKK